MTTKEYFLETLKSETPRFVRVLEAVGKVPEDELSYKPDPKSRTAFELVTQIFAQESEEFPIILEKGEVDFMKIRPPKWKTVDEVIDLFKMNIEKTEKIVNKMSEEEWNSKARMMSGNKVEWESTKGKMIWGLMLDMIHHRGQLSTYLRPMGGEIPSIYGPTADNPDM